MTDKSQARVALIGYGLAGAVFHAPFISAVDSLKLSAIVTANPERAAQARSDYPDARVLPHADDVFKSSADYDLVVIAAPNKFHHSLARASLDAGLATVVDKPMGTNSEQIADLIARSKTSGKLLTVYQNRRWDGDFLTMRKIISNNSLGKLTRLESRIERYRPEPKADAWRESADPSEAGGLLFDLGSHLIDQVCVLFGEPLSVYAEVRKLRPHVQVDDDVFVALTFPNEMVAHLWASSVARSVAPRFRLLGLNGSFEKYGVDPQEDALRSGLRPESLSWGEDTESGWGRMYATVNGVTVDERIRTENGSYLGFYKNIADVINENALPIVLAEEAFLTTRIIEAAFASA